MFAPAAQPAAVPEKTVVSIGVELTMNLVMGWLVA